MAVQVLLFFELPVIACFARSRAAELAKGLRLSCRYQAEMWKRLVPRLTIPQRLLILTALPLVAVLAIGQMSFRSLYSEHKSFLKDVDSLQAYRGELENFLRFSEILLAERNAAMKFVTQRDAAGVKEEYQGRFAATDAACSEALAKLDRLAATPNAKIFEDKAKQLRTSLADQLPDARKKALDGSVGSGDIFQLYMKLTYSALFISESHRGLFTTPDGLNYFDAILAIQKMQQQELVSVRLLEQGMRTGGLPKVELGILRRQFFVSTENEYYLLKFQPELRAFYKTTVRPGNDENLFYTYMIEQAGTLAERTPPPPFVPKTQTFATLIENHFRAYDTVFAHAFESAEESLRAIAAMRRTRAFRIGAILVLTVLISGGVTLAITRNTRRALLNVSESITGAADDVQAASVQLTTAGEQIARDTSSYASAVDAVGTSISEVSARAETNQTEAAKAAAATHETRDSVDAGLATISELDRAMNEARASGQQINQIISRINDISFQTNLLALNAAVEAARAGEAGAGFAVVANEVRALARRCADAANETAELISASTRNTGEAIAKSDELAARFKKVSEGIHAIDAIVSRIDTNLIGQAGSIREIDSSVSQQREIAQNMAATAEETASTAVSMQNQVTSLEHSVADLDALLGRRRLVCDHEATELTDSVPPSALEASVSSTRA